MMFKSVLSLISSGCFLVLAAASPSIGTVRSSGEFRVDGAAIRGNSTLFDGDIVETAVARSVVQLAGSQLTLLPASRAQVYRDRTILEKGSGLFTGAQQQIEAASLRIAPAAAGAVLQVDVSAPGRIAVTARTGFAEVRNASGVLVASLRPGIALAFEPQTAASQVRLAGVVTSRDGKFFLTDTTANVTAEVQGADLKKYVGKKVEITGSPIPNATPAPGASQVVQVLSVSVVAIAAVAGSAGAAGAAAAGAGGAAAGGISAAATAAIIGGVAVGGTLGGMAAANAGPFSDNPSASRQ